MKKSSIKKIKYIKSVKLTLRIKLKNHINSKKLISKIFYNLNYGYIKNNFSLINKLIKFSSFSNILLMNHYNFMDNIMYNDLFILNYLDNNLNNKMKTMITINKNKKPLSIINVLKRIIFSNKKFFRLIKNEKSFLKLNIYNIYFFLFYYYMINSLQYVSFLKLNNLKRKKSLFTLNIFSKKKLKQSFKFFFKNIILFLYKFSLIKNKKKKIFNILTKKKNNKDIYIRRLTLNYKKKTKNLPQFITNLDEKTKNIYFKQAIAMPRKKKNFDESNKDTFRKKKKQYKKNKININKLNIKNKNKKKYKRKLILDNFINTIEKKFKSISTKENIKTEYDEYIKNFKNKIMEFFKFSLKSKKSYVKKKSSVYFFKKLFFKKTCVKRMAELSFKTDLKLKNAASILKNNKKFKFLTFPVNSICKFFFKNSMYNIFMTLIVLPINLTIGNYSGGHFNILSKRRDRGSINSLKSMAKLISLKIYQSNLSFIIFCPRLFTINNKRLIKTIFYSFKILNRSPITKIYLYRPVIRNGIRAKKIPRK